MSNIEWTEKTWNPIVGCTVTSPGCKDCYAMAMAGRLAANPATPHYKATVKKVKGKSVWTGLINTAPDHVWMEPLKRQKPTTYFVNSMGDLFHPNVPDSEIVKAFAIMALAQQHIFQILTKHPKRMQAFLQSSISWSLIDQWQNDLDLPSKYNENKVQAHHIIQTQGILPNVWLGVSVEDQDHADARIPLLLHTPAAKRFISAEPLLGMVDLTWIGHDMAYDGVMDSLIGRTWVKPVTFLPEEENHKTYRYGEIHFVERELCQHINKLDWVICGGESGHASTARPMRPAWARALRDQCEEAGVPFFFKQWGTCIPWNQVEPRRDRPDDAFFRGQKNLDPKTLDGVRHIDKPFQVRPSHA